MIITKWYRQVKNKAGEFVWDFNHISNGYDVSQTIPTSVSTEQKQGWVKSKWQTHEAQLIDGVVITGAQTC
jgi:hypothetical protein